MGRPEDYIVNWLGRKKTGSAESPSDEDTGMNIVPEDEIVARLRRQGWIGPGGEGDYMFLMR
jgi:hypothetical protein